jgi:hypothetical protein
MPPLQNPEIKGDLTVIITLPVITTNSFLKVYPQAFSSRFIRAYKKTTGQLYFRMALKKIKLPVGKIIVLWVECSR